MAGKFMVAKMGLCLCRQAYVFRRVIKYNYKTLVCRAISVYYVKVCEQNGLVLVIKFNPFSEEELFAKVIHHSKFWGNIGSLLFFRS
jgi:hypothetical protein